jgi:hypothetical protein
MNEEKVDELVQSALRNNTMTSALCAIAMAIVVAAKIISGVYHYQGR